MGNAYPSEPSARRRWIEGFRPDLHRERQQLLETPPLEWLAEEEPDGRGGRASVVTAFLTNRECPWRCLMCDLWRYTTTQTVPVGFVPAQIERVVQAWIQSNPPSDLPRWIKLYNAGSFFDVRAIPRDDLPRIARLCEPFQRVVVECHPALVGPPALQFKQCLAAGAELEVAMGLEVAEPRLLELLNKGVTLDQFGEAVRRLKSMGIRVRAFVLIQPPFSGPERAVELAVTSAQFAWDAGVDTVALIPTRAGNGAMEALAAAGAYKPPTLATIESAFRQALSLHRGQVLLDLWGLERFCENETTAREAHARLHQVNLTQRWV